MSKWELLLVILTILGGFDLAVKGIELLAIVFPRLLSFQSRVWRIIADTVSTPYFKRKAVSTRVEEVVNQVAFKLQRHLPKGWIKRARIRWVRSSQRGQLRDGNVVLRVRPQRTTEQNLMQSLWNYFRTALFPDSQDLLPNELVSAIALA